MDPSSRGGENRALHCQHFTSVFPVVALFPVLWDDLQLVRELRAEAGILDSGESPVEMLSYTRIAHTSMDIDVHAISGRNLTFCIGQ